MSPVAILGIDPGLTGALALYDKAADGLEIADIPTFKVDGKTYIDETGVARIIDDWSPLIRAVWLEKVNAMPAIGKNGQRRGMGAQSAFNFGSGYGLIRGICVANFLKIFDAHPAAWKAKIGVRGKVSANDDAGRMKASQLLPRHAHNWPLKKHTGRADAALIALYGAQEHERQAA